MQCATQLAYSEFDWNLLSVIWEGMMTAMFIIILCLTWIWIFNSWMGCQHSWEAHSSTIGLLEEPDRAKPPWVTTSLWNPCRVGSRKLTLHSQIFFCSLKVLFKSCMAVNKNYIMGSPWETIAQFWSFFSTLSIILTFFCFIHGSSVLQPVLL